MREELKAYVTQRVQGIQERYNFDPDGKADQASAHLALHKPYAQFCELLAIDRKFKLGVPMFYDPAGLAPAKHVEQREAVKQQIYFFRRVGTDVWKVGRSKNRYQRRKTVATGNDGVIEQRYEIEVENAVTAETSLKRYFRYHKTRDHNDPQKGEWFKLPEAVVRDVVRDLRAGRGGRFSASGGTES